MSEQNLCPKCGDALPSLAKSCSCGWGKRHRRADDPPVRDGRCCYESGGLRCRYPGNNSHSILGGGPWYCSVHIAEMGTRFARQAVDESQSWRPPEPAELDPRTDAWFLENFPVMAGETKHEFALRCQAHCRSMLKGFRFKPVVSMREPGEDEQELDHDQTQ